jgi:hypothetical protein
MPRKVSANTVAAATEGALHDVPAVEDVEASRVKMYDSEPNARQTEQNPRSTPVDDGTSF